MNNTEREAVAGALLSRLCTRLEEPRFFSLALDLAGRTKTYSVEKRQSMLRELIKDKK